MSETNQRTTTFPGDMVEVVADRLCDLDYNLPVVDALDVAREIVIDVTIAVDKLRRTEAMG